MNFEEIKKAIELRGTHPELGPAGQGWGIEQNPYEAARFLVDMRELEVRSVLEIGTGPQAGFARFMGNYMGWEVISIDKNRPHNVPPNVKFIQHDVLESVPKQIVGRKFDLVFIDADHTFEATNKAFERYSGFAKKVIAFHDIAGLRDCAGASKHWDILEDAFEGFIPNTIVYNPHRAGKSTLNNIARRLWSLGAYRMQAYVDNTPQKAGIGYFCVGGEIPDALPFAHEPDEMSVETPVTDVTPQNYADFSLKELREMKKERGIRKTTRTKAEYIAALEEDDRGGI